MNKKKILLVCYILASILALLAFTQVLITVDVSGYKSELSEVYSYVSKQTPATQQAASIRGYESYFFWPALVCSIIGSISCIAKYKRGLVTAMGLCTVADLIAMAYMTAFTKDFLIEKFMIGYMIDPAILKKAGVEVVTTLGPCFYLGIAGAVLIAVFTILIFIYVPADEY